MNLEEKDILRLSRQTGKTKFYTKEIMKNIEEIQKFLDDNNLTLEEYLLANIFSDEERKEVKQKWDAMVVEALYRNFEDT
jgi:hypothetical protein